MILNTRLLAFCSFLTCTLPGCDGGSSSEQNQSSTRSGFPSGMVVASPTDTTTTTSKAKPISAARTSEYQSLTAQFESLFSGSTSIADIFDPEAFFAVNSNADCYGPELQYQNHPDGSGGDGTLPTGDLGIWEETQDTGEACAAAQLNAQLNGVENRTFMAMMGLASLIIAYESQGYTWPDDLETVGSSGDLSTELNDVGISDVTFVTAEISYDSSTEQYSYELALTYTRDSSDYDIAVSMVYDKLDGDGDDTTYESLLNLLVEDTFVNSGDDCDDDSVTRAASLHYISNSDTDVRLQARDAMWCDHFDFDTTSSANGLTLSLSDAGLSDEISGYVVNPDTDPDSNSATADGWQNDFAIFTADFNPENLRGDYAYAWQAGPGDDSSRVLDIGLEVSDGSVGESYFGYGLPVDDIGFEPIVKGFICNWAGPGNDHTLLEYAQRQHITLSADSGLYEPTNSNGSSSNITYAPTVSCTYDGSGSFVYDRDLDGDLTDETSDTVNVGASETLELDLMDDSTDSYDGIDDYIINGRGYDLPDYPD